MAKAGFPKTSNWYGKPTIGSTLKVPAPARAVPPAVRPLKTTYSKMGQQNQLFGGFGDTGLAETPSLLGMGKVVNPRKQRNKF